MMDLPLLDWLEVGYRHWKAKTPEGGWYGVFWGQLGWEWQFHWPASYRVDRGTNFDEEGCKAACENRRGLEGTVLE
jgi:hypothetical protein